jgi:DNA-binding MurR/RpiR family transcriptional regulator
MPLAGSQDTIEGLLQSHFESFTRAERQLANALREDYPLSGLVSITAVAQSAGVSAPTVVRMVQKLGFEGFGEFQEALRVELSARISDPIRKRESWAADAPGSHVLNRFTDAVTVNLRQTLSQIDPETFDAAAALLGDAERKLFIVGGRITRALADYLFTHLQIIRPDVTQLGTAPGVWPHYMLDMRPGDIVVVFDIRRYENVLLRLADLAKGRGAEIILFTDQWGSPVAKFARHRFNCRVEVPSAWDSSVTILLILEALIAAVQELDWEGSKSRVEELEEIFDQTRLFRKFI